MNGTYVEEGGVVSDDEKEESGGESTGCEGIAPPPYAQLSQYFSPLERAAEGSGSRGAAFYQQKAKMTMIKAHASKPVRQSGIRALEHLWRRKEGPGGVNIYSYYFSSVHVAYFLDFSLFTR